MVKKPEKQDLNYFINKSCDNNGKYNEGFKGVLKNFFEKGSESNIYKNARERIVNLTNKKKAIASLKEVSSNDKFQEKLSQITLKGQDNKLEALNEVIKAELINELNIYLRVENNDFETALAKMKTSYETIIPEQKYLISNNFLFSKQEVIYDEYVPTFVKGNKKISGVFDKDQQNHYSDDQFNLTDEKRNKSFVDKVRDVIYKAQNRINNEQSKNEILEKILQCGIESPFSYIDRILDLDSKTLESLVKDQSNKELKDNIISQIKDQIARNIEDSNAEVINYNNHKDIINKIAGKAGLINDSEDIDIKIINNFAKYAISPENKKELRKTIIDIKTEVIKDDVKSEKALKYGVKIEKYKTLKCDNKPLEDINKISDLVKGGFSYDLTNENKQKIDQEIVEKQKEMLQSKLSSLLPANNNLNDLVNNLITQKVDLFDEVGEEAEISNAKFDEYAKNTLKSKLTAKNGDLALNFNANQANDIIKNLGFDTIKDDNDRKTLSNLCWNDGDNSELQIMALSKINELLQQKEKSGNDFVKKAIEGIRNELEGQKNQKDLKGILNLFTKDVLSNAINDKSTKLEKKAKEEEDNKRMQERSKILNNKIKNLIDDNSGIGSLFNDFNKKLEEIGFAPDAIGDRGRDLGINERYKTDLTQKFTKFAMNHLKTITNEEIEYTTFNQVFNDFKKDNQVDKILPIITNNKEELVDKLINKSLENSTQYSYQKYGLTHNLLKQQQGEKYQNLIDSFGEEWKQNENNPIYQEISSKIADKLVDRANQSRRTDDNFFQSKAKDDFILEIESKKSYFNKIATIDSKISYLEDENMLYPMIARDLNNKITSMEDGYNKNFLNDFRSIDKVSQDNIIEAFRQYFRENNNVKKTFNEFLDNGNDFEKILQDECQKKIGRLINDNEKATNVNKIDGLENIASTTNINFLNDEYLKNYLDKIEERSLTEELEKLKKSLEGLQMDFPNDEEIKKLEEKLQHHEQEETAKQQREEEEANKNQDKLLNNLDGDIKKLNQNNQDGNIKINKEKYQQNKETIKNVEKEIADLKKEQSDINSKIDGDTKNIAVYDVGESHTLNNIVCAVGFIAGLAVGGPGVILAIGSLCFTKNDDEYISKEIPSYKDQESLKKLSGNKEEIASKEKTLKELEEKDVNLQKIVENNEENIKNIVVDAVKNLDSLLYNCNSESQKTALLGKIQEKIKEINPDAIVNSGLGEDQKQLILNVKNFKSDELSFEKLQEFVNGAKDKLGINDQKHSLENDNEKNQNDKSKVEYASTKENLESKIAEAQNEKNQKIEKNVEEFKGLVDTHKALNEKINDWQKNNNKDVNEKECPIVSLNEENKDIITKIREKLKSHMDKNNEKQQNANLPENKSKENQQTK